MREAPIGVFDSGVGGLTVLKALVAELPHEHFVYLGDTARLPYGTKSPETVARYALQAAEALSEYGVKCLVIACNTASSVGLPAIRAHIHGVPIIGVIEPGAEADERSLGRNVAEAEHDVERRSLGVEVDDQNATTVEREVVRQKRDDRAPALAPLESIEVHDAWCIEQRVNAGMHVGERAEPRLASGWQRRFLALIGHEIET